MASSETLSDMSLGERIAPTRYRHVSLVAQQFDCLEADRAKAMFDTLEADIVVMQETKIQRKDLRDDMVLVPGWDVFFSLPKHKKGVHIHPPPCAAHPILIDGRLLWCCHLHENLKMLSHPRGGGDHRCSLSSQLLYQI